MTTRKAAAVSMESELFEKAKARAQNLGFPTFSSYVVQLIRADLIERGELHIREEAPAKAVSNPLCDTP